MIKVCEYKALCFSQACLKLSWIFGGGSVSFWYLLELLLTLGCLQIRCQSWPKGGEAVDWLEVTLMVSSARLMKKHYYLGALKKRHRRRWRGAGHWWDSARAQKSRRIAPASGWSVSTGGLYIWINDYINGYLLAGGQATGGCPSSLRKGSPSFCCLVRSFARFAPWSVSLGCWCTSKKPSRCRMIIYRES